MIALMVWIAAAAVESGEPVPGSPARVEVAGDWDVRLTAGTVTRHGFEARIRQPVVLAVAPATLIKVRDERHDGLPLFQPGQAGWAKGLVLPQLKTEETSAAGMLIPESVALKKGPGDSPGWTAGKDYGLDPVWATVGRLPDGIPENAPVWIDYDLGRSRIDSVVLGRDGAVSLRQGQPDNATPHPPSVGKGEVVVANVWVPGRLQRLTADNLYPILEESYPEPQRATPPAARLLPRTWARLHKGEPLHVLAWGDSVTAGGAASDEAHRYQNRFVALLKERFPRAQITLTTAGWGGRNSDSFLKEPAGAQFNFNHAVLEPHPDLIVMEFVNDAYLTPDQVEERYSFFLKRFQEIGAEWIILTPHYVRPDWMGSNTDRVETDPRPYVAGLRVFAAKHHVALADASLRWGHLVKEGIPYMTLLANCINHPDDRGHELFARSLMELF